ncbi:transporter substrate-binding domain-containing protein [Chitinimonas sp. PSY-7]|uniref:transporter substrate-binding domain-containing protein n=1 Tax=Chitinimonas sp. PSY-7 TaxID=3459088 RepID=UPI00403FE1FD
MKQHLAFIAISCLAAYSAMADDLEKIQKKGEISIGVRADSPPFGYLDKNRGTISGYDIEFAQYVAKKLGVKPVFLPIAAADRVTSLNNGHIDLIVSALAKTAAREKQLDFSLGYFVATQKFAAKSGRFSNLGQFHEARICSPRGTTTDGLNPPG